MNALETNDFTRGWRAFGDGSAAHDPRFLWLSAEAVRGRLSSARRAAPDIAQEIAEQVRPEWVGLDHDEWGLDHGTWSVLVHLYPEADVPVVQLSINALKPLAYHLDLAARLAPLRERGIANVTVGAEAEGAAELPENVPPDQTNM